MPSKPLGPSDVTAGEELPLVPPESNKVINSNLGFSLGFIGIEGIRWLREDGGVHGARDWVCAWWKLEYGYFGEVGVVEGRLEYDKGKGEVGEEGGEEVDPALFGDWKFIRSG